MWQYMNFLRSFFMCIGAITSLFSYGEKENVKPEVANYNSVGDLKDKYEDNDYYNSATVINENEASSNSDRYTVNLSATLTESYGTIDTDYYAFVLLSDSTVDICVDASQSLYSFDFAVLQYKGRYVNNKVITADESDSYLIYDDDGTVKEKGYSAFLQAGSYVIYLRGKQGRNSNYIIDYNLELSVQRRVADYENINDLKVNKELEGAIWVLDYLPYDNIPFDNLKETIEYYPNDPSKSFLRNYGLEFMVSCIGNFPVKIAEYYIWGGETRYALSKILGYTTKVVNDNLDKIEEKNRKIKEIKFAVDTSTGVLNIVLTVAGLGPISKAVKCGINVAKRLLKVAKIADIFLNSQLEVIGSIDCRYSQVLGTLKGLLDIYIPQEEIDSKGLETCLKEYKSDEVIVLPIYCSFAYDYEKWTLSYFEATVKKFTEKLASEEGYNNALFYKEDYITDVQESSLNSLGKIYAIETADDISKNVRDLRLAKDVEAKEPKPTSISGANNCSEDLYIGEYFWIEYKAEKTATHYFTVKYEYDQINKDMILEQFSSIVKGYSTEGCLATYYTDYKITFDGGEERYIVFSMDLTKNDIVYFRIHREDYYKVTPVTFTADYDLTLKFEHINHDYSTYSWADGVQHRSTCKCGDWIYEPHIISKTNLCAIGGGGIGKKDYCLLCHGVVETGFIIYSSLPNSYEETTNGSFRLSNGVIVLASNDIIKYMNGELVI